MSQEWPSQPELAAEVTRFYELALDTYRRNPLLLREHVGHEESIRTGGYSTRTLQELIQNAADATRHSEGSGRIEVVLTADTLYCANDGSALTEAGLRALTHAFLSEKRGDEIGRFSLGFKSTLAVTSSPQIFSRSVSFGFGGIQARRALQQIAGVHQPVPVLRTAALIDTQLERRADPVLNELAEWATTVVRLPGIQREAFSQIKQQMQEFKPEFLLFAEDVKSLTLKLGSDLNRTLSKASDSEGYIELFDGESNCGRWIVESVDHSPSREALKQVGAAVAREFVKLTVAIPEKLSLQTVGEFWAYFPLADEHTTASGVFNAPWSLNDDRTTLLENSYNREILVAISALFAESVLRLSTEDDPARHFDYLTARGRESRGFGDRLLTQHIPTSAAKLKSVPNAIGELCNPGDLRPLSFAAIAEDLQTLGGPEVHRAWQLAPLTGNDVPHYRCYSDRSRRSRLQRLFAESIIVQQGEVTTDVLTEVKIQNYLSKAPARQLSEWLREWTASSPVDAANAFKVATDLDSVASKQIVSTLPLIPTIGGRASLEQSSMIFLEPVDGIQIEGAQFVLPAFLNERDIRSILVKKGVRKLDSAAILRARIQQLSEEPGNKEWEAVWDAALDLSATAAIDVIRKAGRQLKVPTLDGGWNWPQEVFDVEHSLGSELEGRRLDGERCLATTAHGLGVADSIRAGFPFKDEPCGEEYGLSVISYLDGRKHPDQPAIETIEYSTEPEVGPVSVLVLLHRNGAPEALREKWTTELLTKEFESTCEVTNLDSGETYSVPSYQRWALSESGLANSTRGLVPVSSLLSPKLFKLGRIFPVSAKEWRSIPLPASIEEIPEQLLSGFLQKPEDAATLDDATLTNLIEASVKTLSEIPMRLPARVGRAVESQPVSMISITETEEERAFAQARLQPYIHVCNDGQFTKLQAVGAIPFKDGFSFSIETSGRGAEDLVIDMFTGLREMVFDTSLRDARIVRVAKLSKRVETQSGVTDEDHQALLDGNIIYAKSELDDSQVLHHVNELLGLGLSSAELQRAQQTTVNNQLLDYQSQARSASNDAKRLEVLFGDDDLRETLPEGLWDSLKADGSVDAFTDVASILLQVWGYETVKRLKSKFERLGFRDFPTTWAGATGTIDWVRKFGFDERFAGERSQTLEDMFVVPGAVELHPMHDYQEEISQKLASVLTLRGHDGKAQKAMLELPTGAGKTRVAAETALRLVRDRAIKGTVLWIAQSQELCEQAVQTFNDLWRGMRVPEPLTIVRLWETHEVPRPLTELSVVVATDAKIEKIIEKRPEEYDWLSSPAAVFIDEGHRAGDSPRYTRILKWLGVDGHSWERPLVGLSATPFRGRSEESTRSLVTRFGGTRLTAFESNAYQPLVERGVLAKIKHEVLDGANVQLDANDKKEITGWNRFSSGVLSKIAADEKRLSTLIDHILSLDPTWPILVFTPTVLSAQGLAARLKLKGVNAESVSGETGTKERRRIIERFKNGETRVLTNCDLLTAGFDAPQIRALYVAKPVLSPNAYIQMVGRGLRGPKNGGKEECLIVDLRDNFDGLENGSLAYTEFDYLWEERR